MKISKGAGGKRRHPRPILPTNTSLPPAGWPSSRARSSPDTSKGTESAQVPLEAVAIRARGTSCPCDGRLFAGVQRMSPKTLIRFCVLRWCPALPTCQDPSALSYAAPFPVYPFIHPRDSNSSSFMKN